MMFIKVPFIIVDGKPPSEDVSGFWSRNFHITCDISGTNNAKL